MDQLGPSRRDIVTDLTCPAVSDQHIGERAKRGQRKAAKFDAEWRLIVDTTPIHTSAVLT
jgi:hypothetical protein